MKIAFFDNHAFEQTAFLKANLTSGHDIHFMDARLTKQTAILAAGSPCVCAFVNDRLDEECLKILEEGGLKLLALRSAGYNHVDLRAAEKLQITVVRVPEYSPFSVAEHAAALMLAMNRRLTKSFNRVKEFNFSLEGLVGFDMHGKTVGIIGTGRIGAALIRILHGFGCRILAYDLNPNLELAEQYAVRYVGLDELFRESRIISLHVPLTDATRYMVNTAALAKMQPGVMLVNTSRGGLVDTRALIDSLKSGHIGFAGLDVYEEEGPLFFQDHSGDLMQDDVLARLLTFPNVFVTSHQGFLTQEALDNIACTTLENVTDFERKKPLRNQISPNADAHA